MVFYCVLFVLFETEFYLGLGSNYVVEAVLKLPVLLPLPPQCSDARYAPLQQAYVNLEDTGLRALDKRPTDCTPRHAPVCTDHILCIPCCVSDSYTDAAFLAIVNSAADARHVQMSVQVPLFLIFVFLVLAVPRGTQGLLNAVLG